MKDYLEAQGFQPRSPRDAIKQVFQAELIDDGHIWLDALNERNLTVHTYDEQLSKKMVENIVQLYFPAFKKLYEKLAKEL